jgi:uncharacterized protein
MNCPKCQAVMAAVKVGIVEVERCTGCGGLWFDSLEEEWLKTPSDAAALDVGDPTVGAQHNTQGRIDCPKCHTRTIRMVDVEQPHIWFESCKVCYGRFFDAGEFRDLATSTIEDLVRRLRGSERA